MKLFMGVFFLLFLVTVLGADVFARRDLLTPKQKEALEKVDRVLVEVLAITDQGQTDAKPLAEAAIRQLKEAGYTVLTDPAQPHDVEVKIKCEQRKVWEGTSASGGDADLPDSPSRVWKGPACQLAYLLGGKKMGWQKEVRTDFPDALKAAAEAHAADAGLYAMTKLRERLERYDFPILLAAEWGQEDRLLTLLDDPAATSTRKVLIVAQLGDIFSTKAVPHLLSALKEPDLEIAQAAAVALGNIGQKESIPVLIEAMKSGKPELQAAAAKGLGILGSLHSDFSVITPLIEALKNDDVGVKTEVVLALGKLPDKRSYEPLFALYKSLQKMHSTDSDPKQKKLKEAVNYTLKQIDTWEYIQ
ncbi:MAG: HEAT repeat domain-containing protein [Nitrospirae bacterium]|nr:HEAT repeat domain-containing protein [Nitrospirota bacterium]